MEYGDSVLQRIVSGWREAPAKHALMDLLFVVTISEAAAIQFYYDGQKGRSLHGLRGAVENFCFKTLNVDLHKRESRTGENRVER